ncbi:hypothetical protein ACWCYZ_28770 [Streptomyces virginiae]
MPCPRGGEERGGIRWSATGPAGGGVDVQALAWQAVERLRLAAPDIGIVMRPDGKGLFRAAEFAAQVGDQSPQPREIGRQDGHAQPPYCA